MVPSNFPLFTKLVFRGREGNFFSKDGDKGLEIVTAMLNLLPTGEFRVDSPVAPSSKSLFHMPTFIFF